MLDDVLAALDVHTAKQVVTEALQGELIRGRTVLLVTHNIALTAPIASNAILLGKHGDVVSQGPVSDVLKQDTKLRAQVEKEKEELEKEESVLLEEDADAMCLDIACTLCAAVSPGLDILPTFLANMNRGD